MTLESASTRNKMVFVSDFFQAPGDKVPGEIYWYSPPFFFFFFFFFCKPFLYSSAKMPLWTNVYYYRDIDISTFSQVTSSTAHN